MEYLGENKREGLGRKANSRFILLLLMLVSVMLLLSSLYSAQASVFKKAREGAIDAAAPLLEFFSAPITYVNNIVGYVSDYFLVLEQNEALREENAQLRQWMNEALTLRKTVATYEGLQSYVPPPLARSVDAHVIGESNDAFARSMIVNAGRARNVEVGHAVINNDGLVGHIVDVGAGASRVLLLTDIQSRVPVFIEGASVDAILAGKTRNKPVIDITQTAEPSNIAVGQRVLTSGAGGALPRGLPVGMIEEVGDDEIKIALFANYSRTRLVRVLNYGFPTLDGEVALDGAEPQALSEETTQPENADTPSNVEGN